jgi:DNA-binding LytR/AlgR family response regulator
MRILVVDDEPLARRRLLRLLGKIPDIVVIGEAADGLEARERIAVLSPDLVLLDIAMPELDGLALAASGSLPPIIFTTAHHEHAIQAFELAAIDYLLKPIELERLRRAIERVRARVPPKMENLAQLFEALSRERHAPLRVMARYGNSVRLFDPRRITRFHATDKYVVFDMEGEQMILDDSLNALEEKLAGLRFLRVHRSELINLDQVSALHQADGETTVEMSDGQRVPVSRRALAALKAGLGLL